MKVGDLVRYVESPADSILGAGIIIYVNAVGHWPVYYVYWAGGQASRGAGGHIVHFNEEIEVINEIRRFG